MKSNWKNYLLKGFSETVTFFVGFCILDWLFGRILNYFDIALLSLINGFIVGPLTDKLLKRK